MRNSRERERTFNVEQSLSGSKIPAKKCRELQFQSN
jgi:hypothetical protein